MSDLHGYCIGHVDGCVGVDCLLIMIHRARCVLRMDLALSGGSDLPVGECVVELVPSVLSANSWGVVVIAVDLINGQVSMCVIGLYLARVQFKTLGGSVLSP